MLTLTNPDYNITVIGEFHVDKQERLLCPWKTSTVRYGAEAFIVIHNLCLLIDL